MKTASHSAAADDEPIPVLSAEDRLECLHRCAARLYSVGCRITGGDHVRVELLIVATIRATPDGTTTMTDLTSRLIESAVTDAASRERAERLGTDGATADAEMRSFDRWMDDAVIERCAERLLAPVSADELTSRTSTRQHRASRAGLICAAVIIIGIASVAVVGSLAGDRRQPDPTASALSFTTLGHLINEPPDGFAASGAFVSSAPDVGGWLQVWAAPDANRTSGDWLALATAGRDVSGRFVLDGGRPTTIAGQPAFVATTSDGVQQVSVELIGGGRVTIAGHGQPADDLVGVATDMVIADGSFGFDAASQLLDAGLELVTSQPSPYGTLASAAQVGTQWTTTYQSTDLRRRILLSSRPSTPNDLQVAQFILPAIGSSPDGPFVDEPSASSSTIEVEGRSIVISAKAGVDGTTTYNLQWHDGSDTISLSGTADLDELIASIASIRPATSSEWHEMEGLAPNYYPA
ncbi:MAG: hypothetical protein ABIR32_19655 [Ilumatobacteraceae bacterium]